MPEKCQLCHCSNLIPIEIDYTNTQGLIFVVDSNDPERVVEAREELHALMEEEVLRDALFLVFANKQDLPQAMNSAELADKLGLRAFKRHSWYIQVRVFHESEGLEY